MTGPGIPEASTAPEPKEGFWPLAGWRLRFACHPSVACFNACCADLRLILTPYDILRLKRRLGLPAAEFLEMYAREAGTQGASFPMVRLAMAQGPASPCPFVRAEGCSVYEDRPGACRLYPLGRAASCALPEVGEQERYFVVREAHCRGFNEPRQWTVEEWIRDQGVAEYNAMNRPWMEIVTSRSPRLAELTEAKLRMFYMASYNLDRFREFVFRSNFLARVPVPREEAQRAAEEDEALLVLGMRWLKFALLGEPMAPGSPGPGRI
jgi:hypothetical protein